MRTDQNACDMEMEVWWFHSSIHMMPSIWKDVCSMWKNQPLQRGLQKLQSKMLHSINPQEEQHQDKDDIDMVNVNFINISYITFNSKHSVITANSSTSSGYMCSTI